MCFEEGKEEGGKDDEWWSFCLFTDVCVNVKACDTHMVDSMGKTCAKLSLSNCTFKECHVHAIAHASPTNHDISPSLSMAKHKL